MKIFFHFILSVVLFAFLLDDVIAGRAIRSNGLQMYAFSLEYQNPFHIFIPTRNNKIYNLTPLQFSNHKPDGKRHPPPVQMTDGDCLG